MIIRKAANALRMNYPFVCVLFQIAPLQYSRNHSQEWGLKTDDRWSFTSKMINVADSGSSQAPLASLVTCLGELIKKFVQRTFPVCRDWERKMEGEICSPFWVKSNFYISWCRAAPPGAANRWHCFISPANFLVFSRLFLFFHVQPSIVVASSYSFGMLFLFYPLTLF